MERENVVEGEAAQERGQIRYALVHDLQHLRHLFETGGHNRSRIDRFYQRTISTIPQAGFTLAHFGVTLPEFASEVIRVNRNDENHNEMMQLRQHGISGQGFYRVENLQAAHANCQHLYYFPFLLNGVKRPKIINHTIPSPIKSRCLYKLAVITPLRQQLGDNALVSV